jgi:hypothetical protein
MVRKTKEQKNNELIKAASTIPVSIPSKEDIVNMMTGKYKIAANDTVNFLVTNIYKFSIPFCKARPNKVMAYMISNTELSCDDIAMDMIAARPIKSILCDNVIESLSRIQSYVGNTTLTIKHDITVGKLFMMPQYGNDKLIEIDYTDDIKKAFRKAVKGHIIKIYKALEEKLIKPITFIVED